LAVRFRRVAIALLAFGLVVPQQSVLAEDVQDWATLLDALLIEMGDGNVAEAEARLELLLMRLDDEDLLRGQVAYWLAHSRMSLGDSRGALEALEIATSRADTRERAHALRSQIEALGNQLSVLPFETDLSDGKSPFVHSWMHSAEGQIEIRMESDGNQALLWTTTLRDRTDDQITVNFAQDAPSPVSIALRAKAAPFPAWLHVVAEDKDGTSFRSRTLQIPPSEWTDISVNIADLLPVIPTPNAQIGVVQSLSIQDVTAWQSADRGVRQLWLDDVVIR